MLRPYILGRKHGCCKLYTKADEHAAQGLSRLEPFHGFHVEDRLGQNDELWPAVIGRIMVIKHRGRKSGKEYLTPVNYALVDHEIYCTAGFGSISDWYRNMLANPIIEVWLPEGKRKARAEDISEAPNRLFLLRQVIIASGFAGPLFGINPDIKCMKYTPAQVAAALEYLISEGKCAQGGIGIYDTWVHYDFRGTKARWDFRTKK